MICRDGSIINFSQDFLLWDISSKTNYQPEVICGCDLKIQRILNQGISQQASKFRPVQIDGEYRDLHASENTAINQPFKQDKML